MSEKKSRRHFLITGAWVATGSGIFLGTGLVGSALQGPSSDSSRNILAIGPPGVLRQGSQISAPGVIVLRDEDGIAALSSRCTHLGCTVTGNARGFECACHGSTFARDGRVIHGPAPDPLPWYRVFLGQDGELRVDLSQRVEPSTRLVLDEES